MKKGMKPTKLYCSECGKDLDFVLIDGYSIADDYFEGVDFVVKDNNGKPKCLGVTDDAKEYFEDYNQKKWIRECEDLLSGTHCELGRCPTCDFDEVELPWGKEPSGPIKVLHPLTWEEVVGKVKK